MEFTGKLRRLLGSEYTSFEESMQEPAPVSLRVNPAKRIPDFDEYSPVPWATGAYYLPERKSFTLDPLFHAGCYYVQEASSMFLEKVIRQLTENGESVKVLDLCAAPGGKSTHMLGVLPSGSLLVSNEVVPSRNVILQQNISRWGFPGVVVTQNDPQDFGKLKNFFDIIVVDAPCSGEGLFRKQPEAISEWSEAAVNHCAARQKALLEDVLPALKPGGFLVYSTCTYESTENEDQCRWLEKNFPVKVMKIQNPEKALVVTDYGLRFYPHRVKGEGFFISLMQKDPGDSEAIPGKKPVVKKEAFDAGAYLNIPGDFYYFRKQNDLYAFPFMLWDGMHRLLDTFYVRKAGIHMGSLKGKDFIPSHELALSLDLSKSISKTNLDLNDALRFLRCENIIPPGIHQGWSLASYRDFPLGWMKGIGRRVNNYYPRSQRILKTI